jgi:hypothetical protein
MLKVRFAEILTVVLCLFLVSALPAQESLTNDGVIKLVQSKMSEELILSIIRQQPGTYSLAANDLVTLKEAGISERIISAMLAKSKMEAAPAAVPANIASKPTALISNQYQAISKPGVYYKKGSDYLELITEDVSWKTSGAFKNIASVGIVKKDLNGTLSGPSSRNFLSTPIEIMVNLPSGMTVNSYIVLPLKPKESQRDFMVGPVNKKSGLAKGAIAYGMEKLGENLYRMVFQPALPPGEYGILEVSPSDSATNASRMYSFRILI